jgi:hypothetical protein
MYPSKGVQVQAEVTKFRYPNRGVQVEMSRLRCPSLSCSTASQ